MDEDSKISDTNNIDAMEKSQKDKGWAWVITAGATLHLFFYIGLTRSFGLFFVEFLSFYDTNSSVLSGMIAAQYVVYTLSSLFVLNIGSRIFSNRILIITGGIMTSVGYLITAFSPNIVCLVLAQSIFIGIGISCTTAPIFVVLNSYFEKRLGFANSLVIVGGGIGSFVMPFIIKYLLDSYGFRGALLIISGLVLNDVVAGFVMRPFPSKVNLKRIKGVTETSAYLLRFKGTKKTSDNLFKNHDNHICEDKLLISKTGMKRSVSETGGKKINADELQSLLWKGHQSEISSDKYKEHTVTQTFALRQNNAQTNNSSENSVLRMAAQIFNTTRNSEKKPKAASVNTSNGTSISRLCDSLVLFEMLKNYRLLLVLFVAFVSFCALTMSGTYIPPFAKDQNVTSSERALLVMVTGGCAIVSGLLLTLITDSNVIHRFQIMGVALGILGIATLFNPLFTSFQPFIGYSAVYGFFGSVYFSIVNLLLRETVGPDKMAPVFSLMITTHGLSSATIAPLLGYLRDSSGSYIIPFYVIGIALVIGSIATFCTPLVKRLEEKRLQRTEITS